MSSFQKSLKRYPTQIWRQNRASAAKTKTNDFILWRRNVCNSCPVFLAAPLCELSRDQRNQGAKDVSKEAKHWEAFQLVCEVFPWQNVWICWKFIWVINFTHRSISFPLVGQKEDKDTILSLIFVFINNKSWSSLGCSKQPAKPWLNWLTSSSPLPSTPSPPSPSS